MQPVFITGGTGYMGKRIIPKLLKAGYSVKVLAREQSLQKVPAGSIAVVADPFNADSYAHEIEPGSIFIHLLGVSHPSPKKKTQFYSIDLASAKASAAAATKAGVVHFIYVSVAQYPTKVMEAYQDARAQAENAIIATGIKVTFIRPWYVVGPGHYWPLLFAPIFKILEWIPSTSAKAKALALVPLHKMLRAIEQAVTHPPLNSLQIVEIEDIKNMSDC